ncbi:MAG: type II toxin-antitoxin system HipA family toxin [Pseudobdellovibrionaceae bacterium]|nr:type II toxin-antitoxin system HipA family toxin [Pseudobdellovibrionaceae bacterium]
MNIQSLEIRLWGQTLGHLAKTKSGIAFEFDEAFKAKAIEISPFEIPLATTAIYQPHGRSQTFSGLPGIIADCLPDTYGRAAIQAFYKKHFNLDSHQVGPLEILSYIGPRSIGALEFFPQKAEEISESNVLEVQKLITSARLILKGKADKVADEIIKISSSAGGRQAKALVDFNPHTKEIRAGFDAPMPDFIPCIIKLDGLMEGDEANYYGRLEYLYSQLAKESGIRIPNTYLLEAENEQGPLAHFIIERFDRNIAKEKTHHFASLCGLILRDYREKHSCTYEEYFRVALRLTESQAEVQEAFRRALFNFVFRVQDDHTKNFAFLMNQKGDWTLSPAYDVTYVFGGAALTHQMTFHGKDDAFHRSDILNVGKAFGISKTMAIEILDKILELANQFKSRAMEIGLEDDYVNGVSNRLRRNI